MRSSLVVQQVKDPTMSLQQFGSLLWYGFDPWPRNFHVLLERQKKKKKKKPLVRDGKQADLKSR